MGRGDLARGFLGLGRWSSRQVSTSLSSGGSSRTCFHGATMMRTSTTTDAIAIATSTTVRNDAARGTAITRIIPLRGPVNVFFLPHRLRRDRAPPRRLARPTRRALSSSPGSRWSSRPHRPPPPLPAVWCGPDETGADRRHGARQPGTHRLRVAADRPSRFFECAPLIARDLAGVDEWWRGQDPTRTPRFDLAARGVRHRVRSPSTSRASGSHPMPTPPRRTAPRSAVEQALAANGAVDAEVPRVPRRGSTRRLVRRVAGEQRAGRRSSRRSCSSTATPAASSSGSAPATTGRRRCTVHELLHSLSDPFVRSQPPSACAGAAHVCDGRVDILATDPFSPPRLCSACST